jgi:hypothetical protein
MEEAAGDALAVADHLGWETFSVIGHSMGGRHDDAWPDGMVSRSPAQSCAHAFRAYLDSWSRTDFHDRVRGNPARVLLIAGAHDLVLGAEALEATWLRWYPNAELDVFKDAGHFAPEEAPEALASAVESALARLDRAPRCVPSGHRTDPVKSAGPVGTWRRESPCRGSPGPKTDSPGAARRSAWRPCPLTLPGPARSTPDVLGGIPWLSAFDVNDIVALGKLPSGPR